jgi:hypothetical protein
VDDIIRRVNATLSQYSWIFSNAGSFAEIVDGLKLAGPEFKSTAFLESLLHDNRTSKVLDRMKDFYNNREDGLQRLKHSISRTFKVAEKDLNVVGRCGRVAGDFLRARRVFCRHVQNSLDSVFFLLFLVACFSLFVPFLMAPFSFRKAKQSSAKSFDTALLYPMPSFGPFS